MWYLEEQCPIGCIAEGDDGYEIDEQACNGCGECAIVCPLEIIKKN